MKRVTQGMKFLFLFLPGLLLFISAEAQTRIVRGKVSIENGIPLSNVSIKLKGTNKGTTTDSDGNFSISVDEGGRTLVFSYVGMQTEEVAVGNQTVINITLKQMSQSIGEVVVVAYGTQVKRKLTGSVATVNNEELENRPFSSVDQVLQGKVAGLQSVSPNGQPGGAQTIRIRGVSSITGNNNPLIVVDGIPINSGDFSRVGTTSNALAGINPNDIESVSVLKDAASASVYGSRAANGVILITTKKGKAGKTKIRFDSELGFANVAFQSDLGRPLNGTEYYDLTREGLVNAGATPAQVTSILGGLGFNNGVNTDWLDLVTRQAGFSNFNLSASGGDAKTQFFISGGYFNQKAPVIGSEFSRYSTNINVKHKASEKLSFNAGINSSYSKLLAPANAGAFRNPVLAGYFLRPGQNPYTADGKTNISIVEFNQVYNPLAIIEYDRSILNNIKVIATGSVDYSPFKNFRLSSKAGLDYITIEEERYDNPFFGDSRATGGRVINFNTRLANWVWTNKADYHADFLSQNLGMDVTVGYETQKSKQYNISATGTGLPSTTLLALPVPSTPVTSSGARNDFAQTAIFSILQFNYKSTLSLSGSFRRDGSSRFGPDYRYGNFWSTGAAWNIDQEKFFQNIKIFNALKLRASIGQNGNNTGTGPYEWRATYAFGTASNYNLQPGSAPNFVGNPELTWEKNTVRNIALDFSMFQNRFGGTVEYYSRLSEDLLFDVPTSRTVGFNSIKSNVGAMVNRGFEITLNGTPVRTKDFTIDLNFNISLNQNEITKLPNNNSDIPGFNFIRRVGQNVTAVYTRLWAGVDPANGNPQWYSDANKTKTSTLPSFRDIIGQNMPKGFGSFSTLFRYKQVSLDAQFNYQYGHLVYDNWGFIMWSDGAFPQLNKIRKQLDRWQKPGDIAQNPKYVYNNNNQSNAESSRWYYKGDFVRLRELTVSYTMQRSLVSKLKLDNLTFYVRGVNLWTKAFDKNIPFDPEQGFNGTNDLQVLISRTFNAGITVGF
jgi:TonB-dependent starch-binding outer membrane protein SusC